MVKEIYCLKCNLWFMRNLISLSLLLAFMLTFSEFWAFNKGRNIFAAVTTTKSHMNNQSRYKTFIQNGLTLICAKLKPSSSFHTYSRSSLVRFTNAFTAIFLIWFWFKYKYLSPSNPLKASPWIVVIWFSLRKIEWSWVRPLNASEGTSLIWLNLKSL